MADPGELREILNLGPRSQPVEAKVVRAMTEADLSTAQLPLPSREHHSLSRLASSHHQLARALALGMSIEQASLTTGYSMVYISKLQNQDPAFKGLLEHYAHEREVVFIDTAERMKSLGLDSLEELQRRLAEEPEGWTKRELMELSRMMLVEPGRVTGGSGSAPVAVNISFVKPEPTAAPSITLDATDCVAEGE